MFLWSNNMGGVSPVARCGVALYICRILGNCRFQSSQSVDADRNAFFKNLRKHSIFPLLLGKYSEEKDMFHSCHSQIFDKMCTHKLSTIVWDYTVRETVHARITFLQNSHPQGLLCVERWTLLTLMDELNTWMRLETVNKQIICAITWLNIMH